jgi:hypothetical protein
VPAAAQAAKVSMDEDRWRDLGLHTGEPDRPAFLAAVRECYTLAHIPWHGNVVWTSSPLVVALAAPAAALLITLRHCGYGATYDGELEKALQGMVQGSIAAALSQAVREIVSQSQPDPASAPTPVLPLDRAVELAAAGAVAEHLQCTAGVPRGDSGPALRPMRLAVRSAVQSALISPGATGTPIELALHEVIRRAWFRYISGQRRVAFGVLLDDVRGIDDSYRCERAYQDAIEGSCCWHPHQEFLLASEWPQEIHLEVIPPHGSNELAYPKLHSTTGSAMSWRDGWSVDVAHDRHEINDATPGLEGSHVSHAGYANLINLQS